MAILFVAAGQSGVLNQELTANAIISITDATDMVVAYGAGTLQPTGITFDGVAMTASVGVQAGSTGAAAKFFYILDDSLPAAGTYTVTATFASTGRDVMAGAIALSGVKQAAPEATASTSQTTASTAAQTMPITTITNGAWIVDVAVASSTTLAPGSTAAGQESRQEFSSTSATISLEVGLSTKEIATAASTDMSWTQTSTAATGTEVTFAVFGNSSLNSINF